MKKAGKIAVIAALLVILGLLGVMAVRAFMIFIVVGVNALRGDEAVDEPASTAAAATLAPGDDPSWSLIEGGAPVDIPADQLGPADTVEDNK